MKTLALLLLLAAAFHAGRAYQLHARGETTWADALTLCHFQRVDHRPGWGPEIEPQP